MPFRIDNPAFGGARGAMFIGVWGDSCWVDISYSEPLGEPSHWMPLPELPKYTQKTGNPNQAIAAEVLEAASGRAGAPSDRRGVS